MPMFLLFALLAGVSSVPVAGNGRIALVLRSHQTDQPKVALVLRRTESDAAPMEMVVEPDASPVAMELREGMWIIDVRDDHLWHAPQEFFVSASGTTQVLVDVWPRATVVGGVATKSKTVPQELKVRFEPAAPATGVTAPSGEVRCPIGQAVFTCSLPAGEFDLRLRPPGYIAQYVSRLLLAPATAKDLGVISFREGQSITGHVQLPRRFEGDPTDVVVTSEPMFGTGPATEKLLIVTAKPDKTGFFHVDGVAPGAYAVRAQYGRVLYSPEIEVEVRPGREAELINPVVLDYPRKARVTITPASAPANKPWHVRLAKFVGEQNLDAVTESNATTDGAWQSPRLQPGQYQITIGTIDGDVWAEQPVDVTSGDADVLVAIPSARELRGLITIGDDPLADASLTFSQPPGSQISTKSDADGQFHVVVPRTSGETFDVQIGAKTPTIERRVKVDVPTDGDSIEIKLPTSGLMGEVVDAAGTPVAGAFVYISSGDPGDALIQPQSDRSGKFEARGLAPGLYSLVAVAFKKESEPLTVDVKADDVTEPVRLILHEAGLLRGRIVSSSGGVPGARVSARAVDVDQMIVAGPPSGASGEFAVPVPRDARFFDLTVAATGFSFLIRRVRLGGQALTVDIEQAGGTLIIRSDPEDTTYIVHDGGTVPLMAIANSWPARMEALPAGSQQLAIAMMDPGSYSACVVDPSQERPFRMTSGQTSGRCTQGFLAPFGALMLDVRSKSPDNRATKSNASF